MISGYLRNKYVQIGMTGLFLVCFNTSIFAGNLPLPQKKPDIHKENDEDGVFSRLGRIFSNDDESTPLPAKKPAFKIKQFSSDIRALQKRQTSNTLSDNDAALYKKIFQLQKNGEIDEADELLKQISNPLLLGHVLYQRYMHPKAYSSTADELEQWMAHYADHPSADKIYALAQRKGSNLRDLRAPVPSNGLGRIAEPTMRRARIYKNPKKQTTSEKQDLSSTRSSILKAVRTGDIKEAISRLQNANVFDNIETDIITAEIAAALLYQGQVAQAFSLADAAAKRSGTYAPKAAWVAGLVSWMHEDYERAAHYFETAALSSYASGWLVTASSYWAARAHMKTGNVTKVSKWLLRGMEYPRTFYGLISTRALGKDFAFNWSLPTFTKEHHDKLASLPAGARAIALAKIGLAQSAQAELLRIKPSDALERRSFLAFAGYAQLPALSMRLAGAYRGPNQIYYDAAFYPYVPWKPKNGFEIDEALIHAIMKQESRFNPLAKSPSGAMGLMQLMPATARAVSSNKATFMDEPSVNLEIGQRYLKHLLDLSQVDHNLLNLLIAYNAGPGNLKKWQERWKDVEDPLLFIELLPSAETRAYIERVLANYWIYKMRANEPLNSLEAIAAGRPALYR